MTATEPCDHRSIDWPSERRSPNGAGLPVPRWLRLLAVDAHAAVAGAGELRHRAPGRGRDRDVGSGDRSAGHRTARSIATRAAAFDDLVRAAQTAVADTTGIASVLAVPSRTVDRQMWSLTTLDGLAPVLEVTRGRARTRPADDIGADDSEAGGDDGANAGEEAMFGFLMQSLMPVLLGVWSGWMIGQLSHQALGQYDLPLPLGGRADAVVRRAQRRRLRGGVGTACRRAALRARVPRDRARRAALGAVGSRTARAARARVRRTRTR